MRNAARPDHSDLSVGIVSQPTLVYLPQRCLTSGHVTTKGTATMNTTRTVKRIIAGALLSGCVAVGGLGLTTGTAQADNDHCSTRSGCYKGPGMRWCPGDYVWPGLRATGWDLSVCHVYHEECPPGYYGGCPDSIAEGPGPPPLPVPTESRPCPPFAWMCP